MSERENEIMIPAPVIAKEFGVTRRTINRWMNNKAMEFPIPAEINNRLFFARSQIE
ncbi:putative DNA-binding transcriptional regulator AlpA [Rhodoblastus sphagnicola]|uniref:hypothetical protein n=1 Tax=Rhodoblastus sphagnicola TaxID=333368 RepID=UPI001610D4DC|nr:hypothetical protein [Rhodoblastus sphagnicola]MBB4201203.1 putative DNA-binding transcriptional regulator AlpA [Rhodoblastus sphagnicola]